MTEALGPDDPVEISGYVLRGRLGEGGMGSVYLSHTRGGQPVALKVIRREFGRNAEFVRRFVREVEAARRVQGAYTAAVLDSSVEGPRPWLASAYVAGPSLASAVEEHGPLPPRTVLLLVAGVAEALQSVHGAGIVHRDLKPSNVLLADDGPRVIDFGIARATDATALTGTGVRLGTPAYMAPEQAVGTEAGPALDVFALGLVAHFAATGGHPFGEGDGHALLYRIVSQEPDLAACPEALRPLVARCLTKEPERRPGLAEVIDECHRIAAADGIALARGEGWWLPAGVADDVARLTHVLLPPPTVPDGTAPAPPAPPAPPVTVPAESGPDGGGPGAGRRFATALLGGPRRRTKAVAAVLAVAVIVAGAVIAVQLGGDDGPSDSPGWRAQRTDVPLTIPAPVFDKQSNYQEYGSGQCVNGDGALFKSTVFVDLNTLKVHAGQSDKTADDIPTSYTLRYADCSDGLGTSGAGPQSGFQLLEGRGSWGVVDKHAISAADCRKAATSKKLDSTVTVGQIQSRKVLHSGMGLCVLGRNQTLVLLWFTKDRPRPDQDDLREFSVQATQWLPT
ncbi:serine/threonine-protein kinase [Streptomyces sp. NPDC050560]|uniref:serine/threonine-protein kinase n=1 Tax=Streptomyces sp. NPDC050560 TaxID=3365630 RepID=UPI00379BEA5E